MWVGRELHPKLRVLGEIHLQHQFRSSRSLNQMMRLETIDLSQRGGECLSKSYKNVRSPLKWRCAKGHVWETTADYVKNQGYWCGICAKEE